MKWILYISLLLIVIGCNEAKSSALTVVTEAPMDRLPDNICGEIAMKAIDYAGGWDAWESKKNFSFYKIITQVDSAGAIIKKVRQHHKYMLSPHFKANMSWSIGDDNYEIINNGNQAKKYKNGEELTDEKSKKEAWNSSFGSNYVISMPFKFTDPGVTLTYDGIDAANVDRPVHAVQVDYAPGAGSSGGMHKWWYYLDATTGDLVANYLDSGNGHSLTTYETFENVGGMRFHNKRYSYASNKNKEKVRLKTIYENEEMKFDLQLDPKLFVLK